jgi:hypothetical protein
MMACLNDALARAERHVREAEVHVAHQVAIIGILDRDFRPKTATLAREVLTALQRTLEHAREHLRVEREARGPASEPPVAPLA